MKTHILKFGIIVSAASLAIISCKPEREIPVVGNYIPVQDVFAENYNIVPNNNIVQFVFRPTSLNNKAAALGRVLFYDTRLSLSGAVACASCHKQEHGFADNVAFSVGFKGLGTDLNALPMSNLENDRILFWENRATSLNNLSLMPVENHIEMGFVHVDDVVKRIQRIPWYQDAFRKVYGLGHSADKYLISDALTTFMKALRSLDSKYDQGAPESNFSSVNFSNFNNIENMGKDLFFNKYNCGTCHGSVSKLVGGWSESFSNIGLPKTGSELDYLFNKSTKVPSLRNIELTAPYMHDGRFNTLEEVIDHYSTGIQMNEGLSWSLRTESNGVSVAKKFNITEDEKTALIAFLKTLTDHNYTQDKRFSNPFMQ